ncbi:unnamed protein product [Prunus armeniaca]
MSPEDEELTAFHTSKGIYCYKVMPFGLKNAGATYQRAMQKNFGGMFHKNVKCYIDGLVVKSQRREDHLKDLRTVFNRLWKYQLKMNPSKCAFGVTSGLSQYLEEHKEVLIEFITIRSSYSGKPLVLYIAAQERSIRALLVQENESHKEHYMQAFTVHLIAQADPTRYVMSKPVLTGHLAKWALLLNQYEIIYTPAKVVKGQAVVDFLADHPIPEDWEISDDIPEEQVFFTDVFPAWTMFFDGSTRIDGAGASVVFISLERHVLPIHSA